MENIAQVSKNGKTGPGRVRVGDRGWERRQQRAITWVKSNEANKPEFDWLTKLRHWNAKTHKTNTVDLDFRQLTRGHLMTDQGDRETDKS